MKAISAAKQKTVVLAKHGFEIEENYIEELLQSHHNKSYHEDLVVLERTLVKEHEGPETSQAQQQNNMFSHTKCCQRLFKRSL